ncbi:MAG: phosphoribosylformylglycinamidine synthase subunit PurS [Wolinella sp.]
MEARITISLKSGVLDPQAKAINHALESLGFLGIRGINMSKLITLKFDESDPAKAKETAVQMCETLLANTVIEDYAIEILP